MLRAVGITRNQTDNKQLDHAPGMCCAVVACCDRQVADGAQQIVGGNIAANRTSRCGCAKQPGQGGLEIGPEVIGQRVKGRIAGMQGGCQAFFRCNEIGVAQQPLPKRVAGRKVGGHRGCGGDTRVNLAAKDGCDQIGPLGKPPIELLPNSWTVFRLIQATSCTCW